MLQNTPHPEAVRALLRRVDDVRGLSNLPPLLGAEGAENGDVLFSLASELVEELERSHRRLIETNVQLVSLREVATSMLASASSEEATRTVVLYLLRALDFDDVFLGLVDPSSGELVGTWGRRRDQGVTTHPLHAALTTETGSSGRALWGRRTVHIRDPQRNPPFRLRGDHPLVEVMEGLGGYVLVPLARSRRPVHGNDECAERCPFRAESPPDAYPGPGAESGWSDARDQARSRCLGCPRFPMLGVLGIGRRDGTSTLGAPEVTLLESVGLSVAPMIENAQLHQDLRRGQRFLDDVLNSMSTGVVAIGSDERILVFSRAAEELTGHRQDEVTGAEYGVVFAEEGRLLVHATLHEGREFLREETYARRPDGAEVPVSLTTSRLRDDRGQVYGAIATFTDLTRVRRMEERIRQLDRLAAIGRFTASVAHEIRNPLAGISAGVEYLRKGFPESGEQQGHVQFIQNEIARLDRIIGDLFTVSHPKALQVRRAPIAPVLTRAVQNVQSLIDERGLRIEWTLPEALPPVPIDPDQIQQVFLNLLKNAAEASPPGGRLSVRVWVAMGEPEGLAPSIGLATHVAIEDEGPGFPAEHSTRLFEPFFTTKPGGTGLGLYVCHDIVKRHGGTLRVRAEEPGRGACVTVELPLDSPQGGSDAR